MEGIPIQATLLLAFFLVSPMVCSEGNDVRQSLVQFMDKLSPNKQGDESWGWNLTSEPCTHKWKGVKCDPNSSIIRKIVLNGLEFNGILDPESLCSVTSLSVISLVGNNIVGVIPKEISHCKHLTHLYLSGNQLSGGIPTSILQLTGLKRIDLSNNNFTGKLPELRKMKGMLSLLVQNNHFSGVLPKLDFAHLEELNVSNNDFSGQIPDVKDRFGADSFSGNPQLCGKPLPNDCTPVSLNQKSKARSTDRFLIYLGYGFIALVIVLIIVLKFVSLSRRKKKEANDVEVGEDRDQHGKSRGLTSSEFNTPGEFGSEYLMTSMDSGVAPPALVVLDDNAIKNLNFDGLLRAPAELLGRGRHGTLYKVMLDDGVHVAVKRIKECGLSSDEFEWRMKKIDQAKHPKVLAPVAFYCSKLEKLLVYEYKPNGSLFKLLHGTADGQTFDWGSRLAAAASIAEALAFMHKELWEDGVAHGNLKSTNILINNNMDLCISEYGITMVESQDKSYDINLGMKNSFGVDIYAFGVILLELLTGKMVENNGVDLARWVNSVVREEWTAEVFDSVLISEGANEERMVNLLQIALKCIGPMIERQKASEIAAMIHALKEEDERSIISEPSPTFLAPKECGSSENILVQQSSS